MEVSGLWDEQGWVGGPNRRHPVAPNQKVGRRRLQPVPAHNRRA